MPTIEAVACAHDADSAPADRAAGRGRRPVRLLYVLGTSAAMGVVWFSVVRGRALQRTRPEVFLGAAPLVGRDPHDGWHWRFGAGLVAAALVAAAVVVATRSGWVWRARMRVVTAAASLAAMGFAVALALVDGTDGLLHGAGHETEYLVNLRLTPPAAEFVRTFLDRIDDYSVHVRGHPPGFVLVLKALAWVGLGGVWPAALLSVLAVAVVVAATLMSVRAIAGDEWARRAAPFLTVAPYVLWMVTSADAVYTAVGATAVAAIAAATRRDAPPRPGVASSVALGLASGALIGALAYFTYLGVVFGIVPAAVLAVAVVQRRPAAWRVAAAAVAGVGAVVAGYAAAGFWWIDGARRTRTEYWEGTAQFRDWSYFRWANLAVALLAIGPAVVAGMMRLRDWRMWVLVGGTFAALAASHWSQYTRGEVERIWLLFFPWLTVAAASLLTHERRHTAGWWVGVQAAYAICLQAALVSKW